MAFIFPCVRSVGLPEIILLVTWLDQAKQSVTQHYPLKGDKEFNLRTGSPLGQMLSFLLRLFFTLGEIKLHYF